MRLAGFALAFALILLLKWDSLEEPPFWDAAMGLFPAAITLAATDFDVLELLAAPRYQEGGPNTHATAPLTFATALVLSVGGGTSRLVVLHLLHFALAAWALVVFYRLSLPSFDRAGAMMLCLAVLLHPTFSAQVGSLYLEVMLFLCSASAIHAWVRGRFWPAALWGALGWATKQTGGIVPAALAAATLMEQRPARDKVRRIAILLGLPALWTVGWGALGRIAVGASGEYEVVPSLDAVFGGLWHYTERFLLNVPDLVAYFGVFAVAVAASAVPIVGALRREPTDPKNRKPDQHERLLAGLSGLAILFFVLLFLVVLPRLAGFTIVLPRYYVIILPFLLLWVGWAVKWTLGRRLPRAPAATFVILAVVFAANTNGALYPLDIDTDGPGNDPPLTERSNAYKRLLALQLEAMDALQELPDGSPVYYGHLEHYLLRYPDLAYARGPLPDGHNFNVESLAPLASAEPFPDCVYALFNYPWLGGDKILALIRLAEIRPDVTAEVVRELRDGRYAILLVRVQRADAVCPA